MMQASDFHPCVVIPVYNHGRTLRATVAAIDRFGVPIYVVDDGSDAMTRDALNEVAREFPRMKLSRLSANRGKGAAVISGFKQAYADGMTHALQIDADGQHDISDVPRFLDLGRAHRAAVVCGQPVYDGSVPKSRLYGRYLTHFWVWLETLSFDVKDSMCGFRLYPLAATAALIDSVPLPPRMDFDIAIIVHLAWRGIPIENLRTRVVYPPGGLSHFDMLRDNLRISRTHTRLVFGMLPRLPLLLGRRIARRGQR